MDDDDAFLYGDTADVKEEVKPSHTQDDTDASNGGVSSSMAASLAAYGIDPTSAVKEEALAEDVVEDGGSDSDSDSDDEVSFVMNAGRGLDLRQGAKQQSHVIGIGKWAHTATSSAPPAASPAPLTAGTPSKAAPTPDALTDYTPAARPGVATSLPAPASAVTSGSAVGDVKPIPQAGNGPPPTTPLPHSNLAVQTAPSNGPHLNPSNPTGIIPSTGTSVYDVDVAQFEGSGQMWRRPGSDISDWFNYGFDEVTYPKFLKYRQDMEQGRAALAQMGSMNQMTPEVAQMLHLPMGQMNNMQQLQMQQQMQQMMAMQGMDQAMFMQMQQMQNMQNQQQGSNGGPGQNDGQGQPEQEEGSIPQDADAAPPSGPRGGPAARGGAAMRGRVPTGPRVPAPRGPKNRFRDKDRVTDSAAGSLDYGAEGGSGPHSREPSRSRSPSPYERFERRERSRSPSRSRDRSRDRDWERERDRDRERERDRDRNSRSSRRTRHVDGEEGEYQSHDDDRASRRKRSRSVEEERPRRSTRARRER